MAGHGVLVEPWEVIPDALKVREVQGQQVFSVD
jgi:hypothetical protein